MNHRRSLCHYTVSISEWPCADWDLFKPFEDSTRVLGQTIPFPYIIHFTEENIKTTA